MADVHGPANTPILGRNTVIRGQRRRILQEPTSDVHLRFTGYGASEPAGVPINGDVYILTVGGTSTATQVPDALAHRSVLWCTATVLASLEGPFGSQVTRWHDLSGNGNDLLAGVGTPPTWINPGTGWSSARTVGSGFGTTMIVPNLNLPQPFWMWVKGGCVLSRPGIAGLTWDPNAFSGAPTLGLGNPAVTGAPARTPFYPTENIFINVAGGVGTGRFGGADMTWVGVGSAGFSSAGTISGSWYLQDIAFGSGSLTSEDMFDILTFGVQLTNRGDYA